jgi:hypothetical protein
MVCLSETGKPLPVANDQQIGNFIASLICFGTSHIDGDASFRIPLGIFFVIPTILFISTFFIPEVREQVHSAKLSCAD